MADYNQITSDSVVDLVFHLNWKGGNTVHSEGFQASRVNIWRDTLPPPLLDGLRGKEAGERLHVDLAHEEVAAVFDRHDLIDVKRSQFDRRPTDGGIIEPRFGRFYPKGMLRGVDGIFRANVQPFRCVGLNNGHLTADFNHPLADKDLRLSVVVGRVEPKNSERGGTSVEWLESLTSGPGMQARWRGQPTDYFSTDAFGRGDEQPDARFYRNPRFVHHIDDGAREVITNTYGRFLNDGMEVLDLMSSWQSHVPAPLSPARMVGLGLNADELKRNAQLSDVLVRDLNADAALPFDADTFDAVVNSLSVEYLTDPLGVFREVARILRPGGYFIVTFSNRWFPTKSIKIWQELHEFERMGLVLEYFLRAGGFKDLQTYSMRGLPRPHDDKYFPQLPHSDPVYAVWGRKR